jgi:hypothetical protein
MFDIHTLIQEVANTRACFHSEADFQHAFAWALHLRYPAALIRLERPIKSTLGLLHLDVVADFDGNLHAFELKYKTRAATTNICAELYELQNHGAQPLGRYDFLNDVFRLESIQENSPRVNAYTLMLTNDSAYWSEPRGLDDTSAAFSLHNGRRVFGHLEWSARASAGTKKKRERPIDLVGEYVLEWRDFSVIDCRDYSLFRSLAVEVATTQAFNNTGVANGDRS